MFSTLVRLLGTFDAAEEALHDAFIAAADHWPMTSAPPRVSSLRRAGDVLVQHRLQRLVARCGYLDEDRFTVRAPYAPIAKNLA